MLTARLLAGAPRLRSSRRLVHRRDLLAELVARDMKLRYRRSVLGVAWSLLNPLSQLLVLSFVFRVILPLDIPNYPSFLLTGLLVWTWFHGSLQSATGAVVEGRDLVQRPGFPAAILPAVSVTSQLVHFLLALPVLLVFLALNGIWPTSALLALLPIVALQFVLTLGLAYFTATFHVTFRDTQYLLGVVLLLGFYLTPVFYDASAIPLQYRTLYYLNPLARLVEAYRAVLLQGTLPDLGSLLALAPIAAVLFGLGYATFRRASSHFGEEL